MSCKSSVTSAIAFVDLATFDELSAYLYGGAMAVTYFVRSVTKANWFSFVATGLRHCSGIANFGEEFSASINRSGDYVLHVWLRVKVPKLAWDTPNDPVILNFSVRWTHNFMHNLIKKVDITFNELCVQEFDNCWLDINHYFRTRGSKRVGYDTMIGEVSDMVTPVNITNGSLLGTGGYFNLPLPFFFTQDCGIALPVAAIPFNDIKINYCLRDWKDMLVVNPGLSGLTRDAILARIVDENGKEPKLQSVETFAHYAVIHNDERVLMGKAPRDILIHQVQHLQEQPFDPLQAQQTYDLRFSHAVHFMAWGAKNITIPGELSNYAVLDADNVDDPVNLNGFDPLAHHTLIYENTARVDMGSDYYSTVVPYYFCDAIPDVSGLHGYSYSLEAFGLDPKGSTGYSKLANVSLCVKPSDAATTDAQNQPAIGTIVPSNTQRKYRFCLRVRNWNIVRLSGGSLGLPVL